MQRESLQISIVHHALRIRAIHQFPRFPDANPRGKVLAIKRLQPPSAPDAAHEERLEDDRLGERHRKRSNAAGCSRQAQTCLRIVSTGSDQRLAAADLVDEGLPALLAFDDFDLHAEKIDRHFRALKSIRKAHAVFLGRHDHVQVPANRPLHKVTQLFIAEAVVIGETLRDDQLRAQRSQLVLKALRPRDPADRPDVLP